MLNERLCRILMEKNLGNILHSHLVYQIDRESQVEKKKEIDELIADFSPQRLDVLGYDETSRKLLRELVDLKEEPNWEKIVVKILKALSSILKREIIEARAIPKPDVSLLETGLKRMPSYDESHQIRIWEKTGETQVYVLNKKLSPEHDGSFKLWRDTEYFFKLFYSKNLFVWDYLNVHEPYRGKGIGTSNVLFIEKMAEELGFSRFSVEYPNRRYWIRKLSYRIPYGYRIGSGRYQYTVEGYKTMKTE